MVSPGAPPPELTLRIHVRILAEPLHFTISEMVDAANRAFAAAGIRVEVGSEMWLDLPELELVNIGRCAPDDLTSDLIRLFEENEGVPAGEVVIYFVRRTFRAVNGCAAHPADAPGALITRTATRWTLAHELGHLLGLGHVDDTRRLMIGSGTARITEDPPVLVAGEVDIMRGSLLLRETWR